LARLDLEHKAADMMIRGEEVATIAKSLNLPVSRVAKLALSSLGRASQVGLRDGVVLREVLLQRSNQIVSAWYGRAIGDEARIVTDLSGRDVAVKLLDKDAADIVRQEGKFQAELIGAYAPKKIEQKVETTTTIDIELSNLLDGNGKKQQYRTVEGTVEAIQSSTAGELHKAIESCCEVPAEVGTDSETEPTDSSR
jgi:hypothetical protein